MNTQLRAKYVEKEMAVKRSIKADKKKWMENIASEAEAEAARSQHLGRAQQYSR